MQVNTDFGFYVVDCNSDVVDFETRFSSGEFCVFI